MIGDVGGAARLRAPPPRPDLSPPPHLREGSMRPRVEARAVTNSTRRMTMTTVLITGTTQRTEAMAESLGRYGVEALASTGTVADLEVALSERRVDGYVQLPPAAAHPADAIGERFRSAALVAPRLAGAAHLCIVADDPDEPASDPQVHE